MKLDWKLISRINNKRSRRGAQMHSQSSAEEDIQRVSALNSAKIGENFFNSIK